MEALMKFQLNRTLLAVLAAFFTLAVLSPEARAIVIHMMAL
jgi:hypothetical protein